MQHLLALGAVEPDMDFFCDDDSMLYEPISPDHDWEIDWRLTEYPEGFIWQCCQRREDEEPCIIRKHLGPEDRAPSSSEDDSEDESSDELTNAACESNV